MTRIRPITLAFAAAFTLSTPAVSLANDELLKMQENPKDWVM